MKKSLKFTLFISVFGVVLLLFFLLYRTDSNSTINLQDLLNLDSNKGVSESVSPNHPVNEKPVVEENKESKSEESTPNESSKISDNMKNIYDSEIPYDYDYSSTNPISYEEVNVENMDSIIQTWLNNNLNTSDVFEKKYKGFTYLLITKNREKNKATILVGSITESDNYIAVSYKTTFKSDLLNNPTNYVLIRINKQKDLKVSEKITASSSDITSFSYKVVSDTSKEYKNDLKKWVNKKKKKSGTYEKIIDNKRYLLVCMGKQSLLGNYLDITNVYADDSTIHVSYIENTNNLLVEIPDGTDKEVKKSVKYYPFILLELSDLKKDVLVTKK